MNQSSRNLTPDLEILIKDKAGNFSFVPVTENIKSLKTRKAPASESVLAEADKLTSYKLQTSGKARHYFDPEDELEAAKFKPQSPAVPSAELEAAAAKLTDSLEVQTSQELQPRLRSVVFSLLKGIRNPREARDVLSRAAALGGLGLKPAQAEIIVSQTIAKKNEIYSRIKGSRLAQELSRQADPGVRVSDIYDDAKNSLARQDRLLTEVKARSVNGSGRDITSGKKPEYVPTKPAQPVGPVDEMRLLTLADFRRLGRTAADAAKRIYQKIDLLGDESLELKAQAIKAWKASPVYQEYLAIGHKSLTSHRSVEEIIKSDSQLKLEEFEAIADLSKSLQF